MSELGVSADITDRFIEMQDRLDSGFDPMEVAAEFIGESLRITPLNPSASIIGREFLSSPRTMAQSLGNQRPLDEQVSKSLVELTEATGAFRELVITRKPLSELKAVGAVLVRNTSLDSRIYQYMEAFRLVEPVDLTPNARVEILHDPASISRWALRRRRSS